MELEPIIEKDYMYGGGVQQKPRQQQNFLKASRKSQPDQNGVNKVKQHTLTLKKERSISASRLLQ